MFLKTGRQREPARRLAIQLAGMGKGGKGKGNGEGKGNNRGRGKDKDPATTATRRPSARGGRTGKEPSTTSKGHQRTTTGGMYKTLWDLHNAGDWIRAGHAPPHAALRNTVDEVPDDPDWVGA